MLTISEGGNSSIQKCLIAKLSHKNDKATPCAYRVNLRSSQIRAPSDQQASEPRQTSDGTYISNFCALPS